MTRLYLTAITLLFSLQLLMSQTISNYIFSQSNGTYTALDNPTLIAEPTSDFGSGSIDDQVYALDNVIPFNFEFDGNTYNALKVHANGFISFGASTDTNTAPLSSTLATFDGVIAPMADNLIALHERDGVTGSLDYQVKGTAPNRQFIVQWSNFNVDAGSSTFSYYNLSFQVILNEDNSIEFIYNGTNSGFTSYEATQVGLKGVDANNYINRYGTGSDAWTNSAQGTSASSSMYLSNSGIPQNGLTFTWTQPSPCVSPTAQPTNLVLNNTGIIIDGSFTASTSADSYLVLRTITGTTPNVPVDGTVYTTGDNTDLNAYVSAFGSDTTIDENYNNADIRGNNDYVYTIYAVNSQCSGGPLYYTNTPLTGTITNCPVSVRSLEATNPTTTAFTLTWENEDNGSALPISHVLEVATDENFNNMVNGSPFTLSEGTETLNVTGLSANTQYYFRGKNVTSFCESIYTSQPINSVYTECLAIATFNEGFDGVSSGYDLPNCWSKLITSDNSSTPTVNVSSSGAFSAPNNISFYGNGATTTSADTKMILVSPELTNVNASTHRLRFKARKSSASATTALKVVALDSRATSANIIEVGSVVSGDLTTDYQEFNVAFNGVSIPAGYNYVGIRRVDGSSYSYLYVDDLHWEEIPSCLEVSDIALTAVNATTATITWTSSASNETSWQYVVQADGTGIPTGAGTTTATNTPTVSGLTAQTDYEVYVRSDCGDYGTWMGPLDFTTPCEAYTIPYTEGFENGYTHNTHVEGCLVQESETGAQRWFVNDTFTNYNREPRTGSWNAYLRYNNTDWLFIPISLTSGQSYTVDVFARQDGTTASNASITISYGNSPSALAMTNTIVAETGIINGDYQKISGNFIPTADAVYYVGIKGDINNSPWYISIDDIKIDLSPNCLEPTDLSASNITDVSATLDWTAGASETLWDVEYGTDGFTQGSGTIQNNISTNTYDLTGLTSNTDYQFYVRANCGGDTSAWAGPFGFTTSCANFTAPYSEDFETADTGSSSNATVPNCWSSVDTGAGYVYVSTDAGSNVFYMYNASDTSGDYMLISPRTTNLSTGNHRVRFNLRGLSGQELLVGTLSDNTDVSTFTAIETLTLSSSSYIEYIIDIPAGSHQFLAFKHGLTGNYDAFRIDNIFVEAIPNCLEVSAIAVSNVGPTSADLTWAVSGSNETNWEYVVQSAGTGLPTSSGTATTTNTLSLTSLTASTDYEVYVRSFCGGSDYGVWIGPVNFSTLQVAPAPWIENFTTTAPEGWTTSGWSRGTNRGATGFGDTGTNLYKNLWSSASTGTFETITVGPLDSDIYELSFMYKQSAFSSPHAPLATWGGYTVEISTDFGDTWTTLDTVTDEAGTGDYIQKAYTLSAYENDYVKIRISAERTAGDFDLSFDVFEIKENSTLGTNDVNLDKQAISIYPNPVNDSFNITTKLDIESVLIYDINGKQVANFTTKKHLNVSNLKSGMYIVKIMTSQGEVYMQKLIKR